MKRLRAFSGHALKLLASLAERPNEWQHGYELSTTLGIKSGTLYPLLMRLAEQGYLEAQWIEPSQPGRPPRHAYRLTPPGLQVALEQGVSQRAAGKPSPA